MGIPSGPTFGNASPEPVYDRDHEQGGVVRLASILAVVLTVQACAQAQPDPAPKPAPTKRAAGTPTVSGTEVDRRIARLELGLMEKEAQVEDLQSRLDDTRQEVVRAMAKLQTLATRAEAASGMAEAELALQSLRTAPGQPSAPEAVQARGCCRKARPNSAKRTTAARSTSPTRPRPWRPRAAAG